MRKLSYNERKHNKCEYCTECKGMYCRHKECVYMPEKKVKMEQEPICDRDCGHCTWTGCPIEPCDDVVSRQAVIGALYDLFDVKNDRLVLIPWSASAIDARINALPSVQPKPKTGHWIESRCDMYECSECDHVYTDLSGERYGMHYCPNCGAKMESEG